MSGKQRILRRCSGIFFYRTTIILHLHIPIDDCFIYSLITLLKESNFGDTCRCVRNLSTLTQRAEYMCDHDCFDGDIPQCGDSYYGTFRLYALGILLRPIIKNYFVLKRKVKSI